MSFFGLFQSKKVVDGVVNGIYNGIDKMNYTEEEKKDNHKVFLKLYEPFKVAQRYLAVIFSIPFVFLHTLYFGMRGVLYTNESAQTALKAIQTDLNDSLGLIVLTLIGFYFAGGTIEGGIRAFAGLKK